MKLADIGRGQHDGFAVLLSGEKEDPTEGAMLLKDIRRIFAEKNVDRLTSSAICAALNNMEERPWCELKHSNGIDPVALSKTLRALTIRSHNVRVGQGCGERLRACGLCRCL
jgi:hypothetical protein